MKLSTSAKLLMRAAYSISVESRVLVTFAEAHQGLMRPGILVIDRDLDDPRVQDGIGAFRGRLEPFQFGEHVVGTNAVRIELDLERGIGRTDLGHAVNAGLAHGIGHRQADEEGFERHGLVDLDEDVLVAAKGVSGCHG